jgi:hypothetical protein
MTEKLADLHGNAFWRSSIVDAPLSSEYTTGR